MRNSIPVYLQVASCSNVVLLLPALISLQGAETRLAMIFHDTNVKSLDLSSYAGIQSLIEVHLCGQQQVAQLSISDQALLDEFLKKALPVGVTFQQFNELLLVLNQNRISRPFYKFFFRADDAPLTVAQLQDGVIRFKGFAMACFGNFRFAFRRLSAMTDLDQLQSELGLCCQDPEKIEAAYSARTEKVLDTSLIPREKTWFVGEITGKLVANELNDFEEYRKKQSNIDADRGAVEFAKQLLAMDADFKSVQATALRNTDVYLTWDYLDIYVATSMRNKWEYEEIYDFTQTLFAKPALTPLKLRYFDPTQSKCQTSRDKGLLEGLMLKRAVCTIYMAQETDTLGKDSELASTLAQGKPVIAYVPQIDPDDYAKVIDSRPLRYAKIRLLHLQAAELLEEIDQLPQLTQKFLQDFAAHRTSQPFDLWAERDQLEFKNKVDYWPELCRKLAEAERLAFDKRADVLQKYHPLAMQMNLRTGVANGVLVVREIDACANLLRAILTNKAEFDIQVESGARTLVEKNSTSVFRAVTNTEKLTNSFWNFWNDQPTT